MHHEECEDTTITHSSFKFGFEAAKIMPRQHTHARCFFEGDDGPSYGKEGEKGGASLDLLHFFGNRDLFVLYFSDELPVSEYA